MKNKYLGWVTEEFIDVITGEITIKEQLKETSKLDVGDSFEYTTNLLVWCDGMGIYIKIPDQCEYRELQQRQEQWPFILAGSLLSELNLLLVFADDTNI